MILYYSDVEYNRYSQVLFVEFGMLALDSPRPMVDDKPTPFGRIKHWLAKLKK